jgi:5-hydroxyisourate hydrolase-like protein (transthyretin family)
MKKILLAALLLCIAQLGFASGTNTKTTAVSVSGTVVDASTKKPLADVTIVAVNSANKSETVTTNAQGQFKITSLPQGTYTLKLAKDDYKNIDKKEVVIKNDGTTKLTIEMVAETLENNSHRSWWDKYDLYL